MERKKNQEQGLFLCSEAKSRCEALTLETVLLELARIGFSQAGDQTGAELKYSSKLKALELLGKHLGMFREQESREEDEGGGVVVLTPVLECPDGPGEGDADG